MNKVNGIEFFKIGIKDNNYDGFLLSDQITLSKKDDIFHTKKRNINDEDRKKGITKFIKDLHAFLSTKDISNYVKEINFDEEFEANTKQKLFDISGIDFNSLQIYTGNIVGSINYKNKQFNINCRFGNEFLHYMIASSSGFLELENLGSLDKNVGLGEWILIYYWKIQLKKAFSLGMYKTYQEKNDNISMLRGTIDINRYIQKSYFDGKTNCTYKEHSYDNIINQVIAMALKKVFKKTTYRQIVKDIFEIKNAFDTIEHIKLNLNFITSKKVLNPFYAKYNEVYNLSLKILQNNFASIGNDNQDFSAFLFDISLLFEHHIRKLLIKNNIQLFIKNKKEFSIPNGISENNIYPDIIIDHGSGKISIFDVKYKHFNQVEGVDRDDRFQLTSYVATHLSKYEIVECGFIYPSNSKYQPINNQTLNIYDNQIPFKIYLYEVSMSKNENEKLKNSFEKNQIDNDICFINKFKRGENDPI